jgi:hypothetical protein
LFTTFITVATFLHFAAFSVVPITTLYIISFRTR